MYISVYRCFEIQDQNFTYYFNNLKNKIIRLIDTVKKTALNSSRTSMPLEHCFPLKLTIFVETGRILSINIV